MLSCISLIYPKRALSDYMQLTCNGYFSCLHVSIVDYKSFFPNDDNCDEATERSNITNAHVLYGISLSVVVPKIFKWLKKSNSSLV